MNNVSLDVPWATTALPVVPQREMTNVNVLPGYTAEETGTTPATLDQPWSQQTLPRPARPAISSLTGMLLNT